jgi:hypothetical protein
MLFEELAVSGQNILCLTNLGALLGPGGKVIVKKVIEKIRAAIAEKAACPSILE